MEKRPYIRGRIIGVSNQPFKEGKKTVLKQILIIAPDEEEEPEEEQRPKQNNIYVLVFNLITPGAKWELLARKKTLVNITVGKPKKIDDLGMVANAKTVQIITSSGLVITKLY